MAPSSYQSLYRRYRPQRFSEVLGQEHVTRALRNAVREGRIGHAYLFSGPRGTGKTSAARILAKVLNCAAPKDGEPCGECENCQAVERGLVVDWLLEQDAASKSKVDDMRDLLDRVPLGTSGKRKVIILDEVHMLSQGAENALLKTLEEPPEHVIFVLATTDPQKVRPTIRSRTQHFEFHLLPPDLVADHVRHVIEDAGLSLEDEDGAVTHVVRMGGGSARDTLSALDQVAALGEVMADTQPVDAILEALVARDAGAALVAVAEAIATGRDPRGLGEAIIGRLRDAFLAVMGAADDHLPAPERARAQELGDQLGPSGLTHALEVLGEALTELSRKPDPRIVIEVALVRLTRPEADRTLDAVIARLDRLESVLQSGLQGGGSAAPASAPASSAGSASTDRPSPDEPSTASSEPAVAQQHDDPPGGRGSSPASGARAALAANRPASSKPRRSGAAASRSRASGSPAQASPPGPAAATPDAPPANPTATAPGSAPPPAGSSARTSAASQATADPAPSKAGGPTSEPPATAAMPSESEPPATAAMPSESEPPATAAMPSESEPAPATAAATASPSEPAPATTATATSVDLSVLTKAWSSTVLGELPISVRSKWRGGTWVESLSDGVARFSVDNQWHQRACEEGRAAVERILSAHLGGPLRVEVVVNGGDPGRSGRGSPSSDGAPGLEPDDDLAAVVGDIGDVSALPDANDVATGGVDLLLREFGGELVEEDPT